jgi:hypothetical protein
MSFDPSWLVSSFIISSLGFVLFMFGKKMGRAPQMLVGVALLLYPYFVSSLLWMWGIAVAAMFALWLSLRAGW